MPQAPLRGEVPTRVTLISERHSQPVYPQVGFVIFLLIEYPYTTLSSPAGRRLSTHAHRVWDLHLSGYCNKTREPPIQRGVSCVSHSYPCGLILAAIGCRLLAWSLQLPAVTRFSTASDTRRLTDCASLLFPLDLCHPRRRSVPRCVPVQRDSTSRHPNLCPRVSPIRHPTRSSCSPHSLPPQPPRSHPRQSPPVTFFFHAPPPIHPFQHNPPRPVHHSPSHSPPASSPHLCPSHWQTPRHLSPPFSCLPGHAFRNKTTTATGRVSICMPPPAHTRHLSSPRPTTAHHRPLLLRPLPGRPLSSVSRNAKPELAERRACRR